jgi:hypothetical protein
MKRQDLTQRLRMKNGREKTYVAISEGWLYLAVIIDLYFKTSNRMVYEFQNDSYAGL